MTSLLAELKRRNVYKVAFAYLILGWLVLQITDVVAPALFLPEWTMSLVTYLGIIGFPFAMLFTWAFELTPEGLKRTREVASEESITGKTGQTLNGVIIAMMGMAIILLLVDRFFIEARAPLAASSEQAERPEQIAAQPEAISGAEDKPRSVAVLPFVNMSKDPDQEYFSDGISEELLNGLAQIKELRVAARTSSFAYKGRNEDITDIGKQLNVETVLEGSVRKSGQRVRITAQLINVSDGFHLWSDTYDRELNDIFAIQDEISAAIVEALRLHLTDVEVVAVASKRPVNLDAYNFYLLARHSVRQRTAPSLEKAQAQYQKAIDLDPGYAAAWAGKATATELLSERHYGDVAVLEARDNAQQLIDMALRLEPGNPEALATQALIDLNHHDAFSALASLDQAIAANPSEGVLYNWHAQALFDLGRYDEAMRGLEQAFRTDPLHRVNRRNLALQYAFEGKAALAREMTAPGEEVHYEIESFIAMHEGRYADRERIFQEGIETVNASEAPLLYAMRDFNRFYGLRADTIAYDEAPETMTIRFDAAHNPALALARIEALPANRHGFRILTSHLIALHQLERYQDILALLASRNIAKSPLYGDVRAVSSYFSWALHYAVSLKQLGREQEARALAQRMFDYIDRAVENGQPPNYFDKLAVLQLVLDDPDAAIGSLRTALQNFDLNWTLLEAPWFKELRGRQDFQEIYSAVMAHTNSERVKLGWTPIEVAEL